MTEKTPVDLSSSLRLVHPMHTVLVTCQGKTGRPNIITLAWAMPTSINPPLVAISISPKRYSHVLINETKEFIVNIPTINILKQTLTCGRTSGKNHDKFKENGLTPQPPQRVKTPAIRECVAHLECQLQSQHETGDHTIFIGKVVAAYVNKDAFTKEYDLKKAKMIFHLGGNDFATLSPHIYNPEK
jgi:flavin reductase (DIM6/NTAB) family NADH-FMN oxidoreductase RutF